ncbi:MAG: hypothetical protein ACR2JQ_04060, partial [Mycobacteriales bacterium]
LPVIRLTVSNISAVSCTGDFGPRNQEVVAFDGSKRIWGSNDCYPSDRSDLQKLRPGAVSEMLSSRPGPAPSCWPTRAH